LSKKWDPKIGTVLLLHYKPKDFQGKNPLGSQIAQSVVHEKDKEECLAKTYMDAARKGMVEIGERIINGQLAPEKANEEKKKDRPPDQLGRQAQAGHVGRVRASLEKTCGGDSRA